MILVTGANGFIGSQMVKLLNEKEPETPLLAVDTVPPETRPAPLKGRNCRFLNRGAMFEFLRTPDARRQITAIIHMGANSSTTETNWDHLLDVNVGDSQKLWTWCTDNAKTFIYASSAATYGSGDKGYDDRTDARELKALNLYGRSKVEFDIWVREQTKTPPHWYGLKFFNVYGPQETHKGAQASVAMKAFHQIRESGRLQLFKSDRPDFRDGEQKRDFIYVKDVCLWMYELLTKKPKSDIYNMGTGQARTWLDLATAVFRALDKPVQIDFIEMPANLKGQYQYFTEAKMEKWKQQGLSSIRYGLEEGVKDYVQNFLLKETT